MLGLPPDVVRALADAGYLTPSSLRGGVPRFALGDLKAFQARALPSDPTDSEPGLATGVVDLGDELDPDVLLALIDGKAGEIAERALQLLGALLPDTIDLTGEQRERFTVEARDRIRAILAVCAHGPGYDDAVEHDLAAIGADAARHGVALPTVLVALRTSRDLVVQTAVELAEERGRRWGLALAVALTRVIPAIDRLSDAVARGYWQAVLEIEAEGIDRFRTVVDRVADGVFTLDASGIVDFVNDALATALGEPAGGLVGQPASEVLGVEPGVDAVVGGLLVRQFERLREGVVVGWDGVVRPSERRLDGGEHPGGAPRVVDQRDRLVDHPVGDGAEGVGGGPSAGRDRRAGVAAEGDRRLQRNPAE